MKTTTRRSERERTGRATRPAAEPGARRSPAGGGVRPGLVDRRAVSAAQRVMQAVADGRVLQRTGTVNVEFMGGKAKLYVPEAATARAAYYGHGVYAGQIDPVAGVTLGYLAPHQSTTSANPTAVELAPNRIAETDAGGKWHSYILTKEAAASSDEAWLELAERAKRAIVWIQEPTNTGAVAAALKGAGYTDLLAVHCREVLGKENVDWDPQTNAQVELDQEGWLIERSAMEGWKDEMFEDLATDAEISDGDIYWDPVAKTSRKVLKANEGGKVRIASLE